MMVTHSSAKLEPIYNDQLPFKPSPLGNTTPPSSLPVATPDRQSPRPTNPFVDSNLTTPPVSPLAESLLVLSGASHNSPIEEIQRYSLNLGDLQARGRYSQSLRSRTRKKGGEETCSVYSYTSEVPSPLSPPNLDKPSNPFQEEPASLPSHLDLTLTSPFNPTFSPKPTEPPMEAENTLKSSFLFNIEGSSKEYTICSEPEEQDNFKAHREKAERRKSTMRVSRHFSARPKLAPSNRPTSFVLPSYATLTLTTDGQGVAEVHEEQRPAIKRNQTLFEPAHQRRPSFVKRKTPGRSLSISGKNAIHEQVNSWEEAKSSWKQYRRTSKKIHWRGVSDDDDEKVLIGTRVGEGHANYALMYNMLTGIRVSVSRCSARPMRTLSMSDFRAANKLAFDVTGNELVPSSKYDFKFKDYAPNVFRQIRSIFGIDPGEYLMSLTHKYIVSELFSPGKSRSFFYYSRDYRFIIKTVHHVEHRFMRKILPRYFQYVKDNPNTLLTRIYGLHRVKIPYTRKIHFLVMANIFPPNKDMHESYDLKGSTLGRRVDEALLPPNSTIPLKDLNWLEKEKIFQLGPLKRKEFLDQLTKDARLLSSLKIMDYSLLVGFHDLRRTKDHSLLERSLSVIQPKNDQLQDFDGRPLAPEFHRTNSGPARSATDDSLSATDTSAISHDVSLFYKDQGGFASTDDSDAPGEIIYYMGIIDILTPYNYAKKIEHHWKALNFDKNAISAVHPRKYAARFLDFLTRSFKDSDRYNTWSTVETEPNAPSSSRIHQRRMTVRRSVRAPTKDSLRVAQPDL